MKDKFLLCVLVIVGCFTFFSCEDDDDSVCRATSKEYLEWKSCVRDSILNEYNVLQKYVKFKTDSVVAVSQTMAYEKFKEFSNTEWVRYEVSKDNEKKFYAVWKVKYSYTPYTFGESKTIVWELPDDIKREIPTLPSWEKYCEEAYEKYAATNPPPQN